MPLTNTRLKPGVNDKDFEAKPLQTTFRFGANVRDRYQRLLE